MAISCQVLELLAQPRASYSVARRHPELRVPEKLRERVDFWKDVFTKYGKFQAVIHHRDFPQAVFDVVDLSVEGERMDPVSFDRLRKREVEARVSAVKQAMKRLATGAAPQGVLEERIVQEMQFMRGGPEKYGRAVKDDLVRSQTGIREKFRLAIERSGRYLPMMEKIFVQDFRLPIELTRLPFVESSFDYTAYSSAGAAGIWQFMPKTAKQYMTVSSLVDERRDPLKATEAAARYLQHAYRTIGSWPLAMTSYNHGIGGVMKRIREYGTRDIVALVEHPSERPFGFASSNFYVSFLAALEAYEERETLFPGLRIEPSLRFTQVRLPRAMSVSHIERQLGADREELRKYNYALAEKIWDGKANLPAGYSLRVPEQFAASVGRLNAPESKVQSVAPPASSIYGGIVYKVRKGDTLTSIARKYHITVQRLKELNDLGDGPLKVGDSLVIRPEENREERGKNEVRGGGAESSVPVAGARYKLRPGDTLYSIARQFGVSVDALMRENGLSSARVKVGQELAIPSGSALSTAAKSAQEQPPASDKIHRVASGESLWSIAQRYGVSVQSIKQRNGLRGNALKAGQRIVIP